MHFVVISERGAPRNFFSCVSAPRDGCAGASFTASRSPFKKMFRVVRFCLAASVAASYAAPVLAETFTGDPEAWRPVYYTDLRLPTGEGQSYASIWQDKLDENNSQAQSDAVSPNTSYAVGNHNAKEWHFTINFQTKLVALTVLNTPAGCTDEIVSPSLGTKIRVCPLRVATFEGEHYSVIEGAGCYLEKTADRGAEDSTATATYVSYDVNLRAFKTRFTVAHVEIPQCAQTILLHPAK